MLVEEHHHHAVIIPHAHGAKPGPCPLRADERAGFTGHALGKLLQRHHSHMRPKYGEHIIRQRLQSAVLLAQAVHRVHRQSLRRGLRNERSRIGAQSLRHRKNQARITVAVDHKAMLLHARMGRIQHIARQHVAVHLTLGKRAHGLLIQLRPPSAPFGLGMVEHRGVQHRASASKQMATPLHVPHQLLKGLFPLA